MKTRSLITLMLLIGCTAIFSIITAFQDKKPWIVPNNYLKMANAAPTNTESIKDGKELWVKHCQSCHGKTGHGDGPKAANLKTEAGNFSLPVTQKQPDGSLFYKISEGRDDMPSFKKKIPETEEIWDLVNFVRTLKS